MLRFSLTQLLMGTAFIAILLSFTQTGGCGKRYAMIECLSFSADGERILVTKLNARNANVPMKGYKADVSRTVSWVNADDGDSLSIIARDFVPGNSGPAFHLWERGRRSVALNPANNELIVTNFGSQGLRRYTESEAGLVLHEIQTSRTMNNLIVSSSGSYVAVSGDHWLQVMDLLEDNKLRLTSAGTWLGFGPTPMAFSDDEQLFVVAENAGLYFFNPQTGKEADRILEYLHAESILMLPDETLIVSDDSTTKRYDLSGDLIDVLSGLSSKILALSPDGTSLAAELQDRIVFYELTSNGITDSLQMSTTVTALSYSPDGQTLAVGDYEGMLHLIDVKSGNTLWSVSPPGRERWPWTYPLAFLILWCVVASMLARRSHKVKRADSVAIAE